MKEYEALILGAGFAGAATAYHLSRLGRSRLLVLEKENAAGTHASGRNACLLRQAVECEATARLIQETLQALENPPQDWPHREVFEGRGSYLLGESKRLRSLLDILFRVGGEARLFPRDALDPSAFPDYREILASADFEALLLSPRDGVVDIAGYLENLIAGAESRGVEFLYSTEVESLRREKKRWRVFAGGQEWDAACVVNAAGAWADELAQASGVERRNLQPKRRHLFASKKFSSQPSQGTYLWDLRHEFYFRAQDDGLLLCAGDETPHNASIPSVDPSIEALLFQKLRQSFPPLAAVSLKEGWACLRTFGPEGRWLDPADPVAEGYFWAAGLGGHGVGMSFGLGRKVAEAVHEFLVGRPRESL